MLDDYLVRAALAAIGLAVPAGLLGCFVVWRRMAYFGDATAHASILGVALAVGAGVSVQGGILGVALAMAVLVFFVAGRRLSTDAVLGVMSHGALALGLLSIALVPGQGRRIDLDAVLFGDVLTVSRGEVALVWAMGAVVCLVLWWRWGGLLTATADPDLATASGLRPGREALVLTVLISLLVAVAIKVVGALLVTALLIIPAAAARPLARTPEGMAAASVGIAVLAAASGLALALRLDTPVGPTIVAASLAAFCASAGTGAVLGRKMY